jgi:hypothetical protein
MIGKVLGIALLAQLPKWCQLTLLMTASILPYQQRAVKANCAKASHAGLRQKAKMLSI